MARSPKRHIPATSTQLDAAWFTKVLGVDLGAAVTAVERSIIGDGVGFVGELHRCQLRWDRTSADLPHSVVVKLPSTNEKNRALAEALGAYEREIVVYRDVGDDLGLPMPKLLHADFDPHPAPWIEKVALFLFDKLPLRGINWVIDRLLGISSNSVRRYVLVIEDVADARPPTQADGGSLDDAVGALRVLARSHACTWNNVELAGRSDWLWPLNRAPKVVMASYLRYRDVFFERFQSLLDESTAAQLDQVQEKYESLMDALSEAPTVLTHGDYRLDNVLFRPNGELVVVDFQGVGVGRPGWDVGYFITTALTSDHRTDESTLLGAYHDELVAAGVNDYSREQLLVDVRITGDLLAHRMVCADDMLDTDRGEGNESLVEVLVARVLGWTTLA